MQQRWLVRVGCRAPIAAAGLRPLQSGEYVHVAIRLRRQEHVDGHVDARLDRMHRAIAEDVVYRAAVPAGRPVDDALASGAAAATASAGTAAATSGRLPV